MYLENHMDIIGMGRRPVQPWNVAGTSVPCIKPNAFIGSNTHRMQLEPWKPNLRYHNTELYPIIPQTVSNYMMDPLCNMKTESLKFPDLTNGPRRSHEPSSQATLFTRYTPGEWFQKQIKYYSEADSNRHYSERIRNDAVKIMREAEEKIQFGQYDTGKRLGERITDVTFWRNEVSAELERLVQEIERLQDCRNILEKSIQDLQGPLHIVEECLYYREGRKGTELVHDNTEKCLLFEVSNLKSCQRRLEACLQRCKDQIRNCRHSQNQLEIDLKKKENSLNIDTHCHQLNNYSEGLQYYSGIEKFDPCISVEESWAMSANRLIQASQTERALSRQLRSEAEALLNRTSQEIWDAWSNTNNALSSRTSEMLEAKSQLQQHLHKLQQEIFNVEKNMELLRKAIADKNYHLKVALTRLEARMHRPDMELCRDHAHLSLQKEIDEINQQVERMHKSLKEIENQHQKLLRTRSALEHDLALKIDAMYIDKEKVTGLRRAYPINSLLRF